VSSLHAIKARIEAECPTATAALIDQPTTRRDLIHVPYRGAGPAISDILAGQIPMIVPAMTNLVLELHRAGKLRVLEVTHGTRLAAAPELPTAVEQGLTDLVAPNFVGVFAPAGTPKKTIQVQRLRR
jgi:tripartite-type tricarboxylate transporter receptor subunit TctC